MHARQIINSHAPPLRQRQQSRTADSTVPLRQQQQSRSPRVGYTADGSNRPQCRSQQHQSRSCGQSRRAPPTYQTETKIKATPSSQQQQAHSTDNRQHSGIMMGSSTSHAVFTHTRQQTARRLLQAAAKDTHPRQQTVLRLTKVDSSSSHAVAHNPDNRTQSYGPNEAAAAVTQSPIVPTTERSHTAPMGQQQQSRSHP